MRQHNQDKFTVPNQKAPGLTLTWTNLARVRPQTSQMVVRDARIQALRAVLLDDPNTSEADVAQLFGVKPLTAREYLRLAKPIHEHVLVTGNTVRVYQDGNRLTGKLFCGDQVKPFEPVVLGAATVTTEAGRTAFYHAMVQWALHGGDQEVPLPAEVSSQWVKAK